MESKLIISCNDDEALVMALIDRDVLDHLPTDQKYNSDMANVLFNEYGYGFISLDDENKFNIPDYISDEDIALWEAEKIIYDSELIASYPEAKKYLKK